MFNENHVAGGTFWRKHADYWSVTQIMHMSTVTNQLTIQGLGAEVCNPKGSSCVTEIVSLQTEVLSQSHDGGVLQTRPRQPLLSGLLRMGTDQTRTFIKALSMNCSI